MLSFMYKLSHSCINLIETRITLNNTRSTAIASTILVLMSPHSSWQSNILATVSALRGGGRLRVFLKASAISPLCSGPRHTVSGQCVRV